MKNRTLKVFITILLFSLMTFVFYGCVSSGSSSEVQAYQERIADLEYELENEYQRGLDHGYENGYSDGYDKGYSEGEEYGYSAGFLDGVEAGYEDGYADCEAGY